MKYTRKTHKLFWRHLDVYHVGQVCFALSLRPGVLLPPVRLEALMPMSHDTVQPPRSPVIISCIISIVTNQQRYSQDASREFLGLRKTCASWIFGSWNYGKLSLNFHGSVPLASSAATSCRRSAWTCYTLLCPWDTMWRSMTSITCVSSAGSGLCLYSFASNKARVRLLSAQILSNAESGNNSENVSHSSPLETYKQSTNWRYLKTVLDSCLFKGYMWATQ